MQIADLKVREWGPTFSSMAWKWWC